MGQRAAKLQAVKGGGLKKVLPFGGPGRVAEFHSEYLSATLFLSIGVWVNVGVNLWFQKNCYS